MNTYEEVYEAVFSEPYYGRAWKGPGGLPVYKQTLTSFIQGLFSHDTPLGLLVAAADRTVRSRADLRWGKDGKGVRRLLHPNGIWLLGKIYPHAGTEYIANAPANFFTQQDIATTFSNSIREGILTNSPPVTPL